MAGPPWFDAPGAPLSDWLAEIRARGWRVETTFDKEKESVTLVISDLRARPGRVRVELPAGSPSVSPTVYGYSYDLDVHQHPTDFNYCLPEKCSGPVEAVEKVIRLYEQAAEGIGALRQSSVPAAEPRSGFVAQAEFKTVLLTVPLPEGSWGTLTVRTSLPRCSGWGWVGAMTAGDDPPVSDPATPPALLASQLRRLTQGGSTERAIWHRTANRRYPIDPFKLRYWWEENARAEALEAEERLVSHTDHGDTHFRIRGLVVPEEGPEFGQWGERLLLLVEDGASIGIVVAAQLPGSRDARIPTMAGIESKTVAIAGCGMLGAHVALSLARSGVGALRLVDSAVVRPGNLVRQPYSVVDMGVSKVHALGTRVAAAAPGCLVEQEYQLSGDIGKTPERVIIDWLSGVDLLVLATGDVGIELYLNRLASELAIPVVGGFVRAGIASGVAWSTTWGVSGCRECMEALDAATLGGPPEFDAPGVFPEGCGNPTFPGIEPDGAIVAAVTSHLALSQLGATLQRPPEAMCVVRLVDEEGRFSIASDWRAFPPAGSCPWCQAHL